MQNYFQQLCDEYSKNQYNPQTMTNCIKYMQEYLSQEKNEDQFLINNGGIKLITPIQWCFEKCYSICLTLNPQEDGSIFTFSSSYIDGKRIIINGVHCYIMAGVLFYKNVYQRFTLEKQLVEDYSSNHKLGDVQMNSLNEIIIQHECGKLYARPKFTYSINSKSQQLQIEYPKIKNQNLEIIYFQNIKCKVKEISVYNDVGDIHHKQPYFQIYPLYNPKTTKKVKDRIQNVVYELLGNTVMTSSLQKFDFVEFGGIKVLIPLFELIQYYNHDQLDDLFEILLFTLLQDSPINKAQIVEYKLLQQIAQIIKVDVKNLSKILKIKQKITDQDILNQLLLLLIDINFIKRVNNEQEYCILLQQFYLSDHHQYLKVTSIQYLAQLLVSITEKNLIQDQILQIMKYTCQFSFATMKEQFKLFLKVAEASVIDLKLKSIQYASRLVSDLSKDDHENFLIFQNHNIQNKILSDILLLLQTDSSDVIISTITLLGLILQGTNNILTNGMISYISKTVIIVNDLENLLNALNSILKINYQCVEILQTLYTQTKNQLILDNYFDFVKKLTQQQQQQILQENSIWFLDQMLLGKNIKLYEIYKFLLANNPINISLLLVHYQLRNDIQLIIMIVNDIIEILKEEQIFTIQKLLFQIYYSLESFRNFDIFLTKLVKFVIYVEEEQQLQELIEQQILVFGIQKVVNLSCPKNVLKEWLFYIGKLFEQAQYLNTNDSESFMLQIFDLLNAIKDNTQDNEIRESIEYFINQNILIFQSLSQQQVQVFDSIKFQEEFQKIQQQQFELWTFESQQQKLTQSEQLSKITDEISQAASTMQVSVYNLVNKYRKIRQKWCKLWHTLRLTIYKPLNCIFQYDEKVDQDYQFQENLYFTQKIDKLINRQYARPILKIKFKKNTVFDQEPQIQLEKKEMHKCFWLKSLYLKQGGISISDDKITFSYYSYTQPANHITLLPHTIPNHKPFKKSWKLTQIRWINDRIYIRNRNALEIIFKDGESLYMIFSDNGLKEEILERLKIPPKTCNFNKVSNFKFLMYLNFLSCRSYVDLTRYPVFPWVLKGNASDFDDMDIESIMNINNYRDFSKPIGAFGSEKRLEQFIKRYENEQFFYGTHYSSQALVSQYLVRLSPFTQAAISIQDGKFDIPDRLFRSIMKSWIDCNDEMAEVRELTPEFFSLPEAFLNLNALNFGKLQTGQMVSNVLLPFYSNKSSFYFVAQNMIALENDVSQKLNEWIDLIWGYKQQGQAAIDSLNVFYPLTYSNFDESILDINELAMETQIAYFGQTPEQLFFKPHPQKNTIPDQYYNQIIKSKKSSQKIILLQCNKTKLVSVHDDYIFQQWSLNKNQYQFEKSVQLNKQEYDAMIRFVQCPLLILIDLQIILYGGNPNGTIIYQCLENNKMQGVIELENEIINNFCTVTVLKSNKNQNIVIIGTNKGFVYYYDDILKNKLDMKYVELLRGKKVIYDTTEQITQIAISDELTIFCVGTQDGTVYIYNLYNRTLYRQIQHPKKLSIVFLELSYSPLTCVLFSSSDDRIIAYSINGFLLQIVQIKGNIDYLGIRKQNINSLVVITDSNVFEYRLPFLDRHSILSVQLSTKFTQLNKNCIIFGTKNGDLRAI